MESLEKSREKSPEHHPENLPGSFESAEIKPALRKQRKRHIVTSKSSHVRQAQTPQQRAANARFAKQQETKMGRPATTTVKRQPQKSPISKGWVGECLPFPTSCCGEILRRFGGLELGRESGD